MSVLLSLPWEMEPAAVMPSAEDRFISTEAIDGGVDERVGTEGEEHSEHVQYAYAARRSAPPPRLHSRADTLRHSLALSLITTARGDDDRSHSGV